jgi:hypothetical protein
LIASFNEGIPQGRPEAKASGYHPRAIGKFERVKAEALTYLEAKALTIAMIDNLSVAGNFKR